MDSLFKKGLLLEQLMPLIREYLDAGKSIRFSPRGTSMLPMLREGLDSVVLSPLPEKIRKYDLILYQRQNGQYVLHRIVSVGEMYTCIGDNQFELEQGVREEQMIALVTAFSRDGRDCAVSHPAYWLYCRVWHISRPVRYLWRRTRGWLRRRIV